VAKLKRLDFQNVPVVGREAELEQLKAAFRSGEHPLVAVSGYSGVGKTTLVTSLLDDIDDEGTWFLTGKYDQQASSRPYSALSLALEKLVEDKSPVVRQVLQENPMDPEQVDLICGMVSSMADVFLSNDSLEAHEDHHTSAINDEVNTGVFRSERMRDAFVSLIRLFSKERKIVMFLDDVHWADEASLDLIQTLVCATNLAPNSAPVVDTNLMTILTFRSNEVSRSPALVQMLETSSPLTLEIGNLSAEALNKVVASSIERHREGECLELSRLFHRKTGGNGKYSPALIFARKMHVFPDANRSLHWTTSWI